MAAGRDRTYRNRGGLEARAGTEQKQGDEGGPGAERKRGAGGRRGIDARLNADLEETRTIAEEGDRPSESASDRPSSKDRSQARDTGYPRDGRTTTDGAESRQPRRSSRQRGPTNERQRDEPDLDYDADVAAAAEERSPYKSKEKARKPEPVARKREPGRSVTEKDGHEDLQEHPRTESAARKPNKKEPSIKSSEREGKAEKAAAEARDAGNLKEREANAVMMAVKSAIEQKGPPVSTKEKAPAKQAAEEKGPDKTPVAVAEDTLDDEDKYSTGSEDYYEEVTEEVVEPDPHDWRQGRGGVVTRRTTRSTTKKRKYGKPGARKSGEKPSSKYAPTTASEKKQRDEETDVENKNETTTSEADDSFPPAQDQDKETGTCPCCGSCWPSHMNESRMKAAQGQSKTWRRRLRRGEEGPAGDEWYEVRNFGPKQVSRSSRRKTDVADAAGGGLQGGVQFTNRMPYPYAPSSASPPPYSAQQLYPPGVQGQDVFYNAYQPNLQGPYQRPPFFSAPAAFPQPYQTPPAVMGAYGGAVQANSATAFPTACCAMCRAQVYSGHLSYPFGGGQPVPTISMEDFLLREQRVRREERLRLEEKQLREEKLRREERVRQEERLRREERARREERRRRELEEERLRQEERLRLEERIREEQRIALETRLEEQRRERLERQRRERIEEQRRYNDSLRRALAEQRMAADRVATAAPPSGFLDEVLIRGRLRPVPSSVLSRVGSQDRLRASTRPARWDDVHRYTEKTGDPRDGWGTSSRGGGRFR